MKASAEYGGVRPELPWPRLKWPVIAAAVGLAMALPWLSSSRWVHLSILFFINALLAQSMNILLGYAGQMSLAQAALYGAGAYGSAVLAVRSGWPLWASVPAGIFFAALLGFVMSIPAGRVRDFYLAVVTLGFGLLVFEVMTNWTQVTGGYSGMTSIPSTALRSLKVGGFVVSLDAYYYISACVVALVTLLVSNVVRSHVGRSFVAIQRSQISSSTLGIALSSTKRLSYVLSAAVAGIAGVLYAHTIGFLSPEAFSLHTSIAVLVFAVLGGMRTIVGPFLGAAVLTYVPDQLASFQEYELIIYGAILLVSYLILPRGIAGMLPGRSVMVSPRAVDDVAKGRASLHPAQDRRIRPAQVEASTDADMILTASRISKSFPGVRALDGASILVRRGSIHGLIGPNGSGKTTLLNVLSGIYAPDSGSVVFGGAECAGWKPEHIARRGMGRTFQHPIIFDDLTVLENVLVGANRLYRSGIAGAMFRTRRARSEERTHIGAALHAISRTSLTDLRDSLGGSLPFGRQRMVELARALCSDPSLLMLDEPAAGLAESDLLDLAIVLKEVNRAGTTILIIEHHVDFLLRLVDTLTVLDQGRVIFSGAPADAKRDVRVIEAYLGTGSGLRHAKDR